MRPHHPLLLWIALTCGCGGAGSSTAAADAPAALDVKEDVKELVAECTGCHKPGPLDLSKHASSILRQKMEAIRAGKAKHVTDMSKLTDAQLDALAAQLGAKE